MLRQIRAKDGCSIERSEPLIGPLGPSAFTFFLGTVRSWPLWPVLASRYGCHRISKDGKYSLALVYLSQVEQIL